MGTETTKTYHFKASEAGVEGKWKGDFSQMTNLVTNTNSKKVSSAASAYTTSATTLETTKTTIYNAGLKLRGDNWQGKGVAKMQRQLKNLWETAETLRKTSNSFGTNLFAGYAMALDLAKTEHPKLEYDEWSSAGISIGLAIGNAIAPSGGMTLANWINDNLNEDEKREANNAAKKYMNTGSDASLGDYVMNYFYASPESMKTTNPNPGPGNDYDGTQNGNIPTDFPGGMPGNPPIGGMPPVDGTPPPGGGMPPGGVTPPGGIHPTDPGNGVPPGTGGTTLAGAGGGGLGTGLGGGLGGGMPATSGMGGGMPGGTPGGLGGALPGGLGGLGRGMGGMPMMPMGGGQAGRNEERERVTWLEEDEDIWGGNDISIAPEVIA